MRPTTGCGDSTAARQAHPTGYGGMSSLHVRASGAADGPSKAARASIGSTPLRDCPRGRVTTSRKGARPTLYTWSTRPGAHDLEHSTIQPHAQRVNETATHRPRMVQGALEPAGVSATIQCMIAPGSGYA